MFSVLQLFLLLLHPYFVEKLKAKRKGCTTPWYSPLKSGFHLATYLNSDSHMFLCPQGCPMWNSGWSHLCLPTKVLWYLTGWQPCPIWHSPVGRTCEVKGSVGSTKLAAGGHNSRYQCLLCQQYHVPQPPPRALVYINWTLSTPCSSESCSW